MNSYVDLRPFSRQPFRTMHQYEVLRSILNSLGTGKKVPTYIVEIENKSFAIKQSEALSLIENINKYSSGHSPKCGYSLSTFTEISSNLDKSNFDFELLKYEESEWMIPEISSDFDLYLSWVQISKHTEVTVVVDDISQLTNNLPVGQSSSVDWSRIYRWIVKQNNIYFTEENVQSEFNELFGISEHGIQKLISIF